MATSLSQIRQLLEPGLHAVTGKYKDIPSVWAKVFAKKKSTLTIERSVSTRFLPLPQLKTEGAAAYTDNNSGTRYTWNAETQEVSLGYAMTRKVLDDNLYKTEFNPQNLGLQRVFAQYKEISAANILNNATTADTAIGGDGKALCATDHPVDGSTYANKPSTEMGLNEASLISAMTTIRTTWVDEANIRVFGRAKNLIVPPALAPVAHRLIHADLRPGTVSNDPNVIKTMDGGLEGGYVVMDFLSSAYAWFLKTNIDGFIYFEKKPFETSMWVDDATDNLNVKGYERYVFVYNDPRAIWGTFPTS